jgi:hypothetical protein
VTVTVEIEPLEVHVDALALVDALAVELAEFYAAQMLRGRTPDGGAMPTNKRGQPLGLGDGTIPRNWEIERGAGDERAASSSTGPYQEGGYYYPVRRLVELGASPVGYDGKAGDLIEGIIDQAADRAIGL